MGRAGAAGAGGTRGGRPLGDGLLSLPCVRWSFLGTCPFREEAEACWPPLSSGCWHSGPWWKHRRFRWTGLGSCPALLLSGVARPDPGRGVLCDPPQEGPGSGALGLGAAGAGSILAEAVQGSRGDAALAAVNALRLTSRLPLSRVNNQSDRTFRRSWSYTLLRMGMQNVPLCGQG